MKDRSTCAVERPPVPVASYTTIPIGPTIRCLSPAVVKTWAAVVQSSWVDPDGQRISRSTKRHLAKLADADPETVTRHLSALAEIGAITNDGQRIVIHERAEGIGELRISLFDDHPAWALSPRAFVVHLGIRRYAGTKSVCNPTDRTLAAFLGMSSDSVKRGMAELRKCLAIVTTCSPFDRDRRSKARTIHLAPAKHWIISKPADPTPDPKTAPQNTSMGAKSRFDDRPERAERIRKSAPEQSGNLHLNNRLSAPIDVLREEKKEPEHPLPPKLTGQSESEGGGVVRKSVPPQDTDPKTALADELIRRFANQIEASALNAIERTDFRRALRKMIADHGPIPGQWIEAALAVRATKNTISLGSVAIKNLRRWTELTADEQAAIPDRTQFEMLEDETAQRKARLERLRSSEPPQIVRSKLDGQERVQRADGTWANKALPAQNGSGTPAHVILAERGLRPSPGVAEPPPPPAIDPAEAERRERELAEERERNRIEFQRSQIERELAEETNRRLAAWTSRRTAELIPAMRSDLSAMRQRLAAERTIEAQRIEAAVRAEFGPRLAALAPSSGSTPPPQLLAAVHA